MRRLVSVVALVSFTGCSFATVRGPGSGPHVTKPACTSSKTAPVVDGLLMGASVPVMLFSLLFWLASEPEKDDQGGYKLGYYAIPIVGGAFGGLGFGVSAIYGGVVVKRCRRAQDDWSRAHMAPQYPAYPQQPYPQQPYPQQPYPQQPYPQQPHPQQPYPQQPQQPYPQPQQP